MPPALRISEREAPNQPGGAAALIVVAVTMIAAWAPACAEPRNSPTDPSTDGRGGATGGSVTTGATGGTASGAGGGAGGAPGPLGSGPADAGSIPGSGGATAPAGGDAAPVPACGVMDGVCLMGCPPSAPDPDCTGTPPSGPKLALGMPCARADACASGFCADGVCCDGVCGSACQSCAQAGRAGACLPVFNEPDPGQCEGAGQICTGASSCAVIDQRTEGATTGTSTYAVGATAAQVVTAGRSGRIAAVRFRVECRVGGSMTVQIQTLANGRPSGTALASELVAREGLAAQKQSEQMIAFTNPPRINAGQKFAITAKLMGAACTFLHTDNAYPSDISWTLPTDGDWYPDEESDLFFQTLMLP